MLHELSVAIAVLYKLLPQGEPLPLTLSIVGLMRRLFTKYLQNMRTLLKVYHTHFNVSSTTFKPLTNQSVSDLLYNGSLADHQVRPNLQSLSGGNRWILSCSTMSRSSAEFCRISWRSR